MPDLPSVNNIPSGVIGSQPFGSDRDLQAQQQLALLRQLQAQADLETASAEKAKTAARLSDPLEAAHAAQSVQDFATRKDVAAPVTDPTTVLGIRGAQPQTTPFGTSTPIVKGIRSVGTAPTMTETRQAAEQIADPNYATAMAGQRAQAMLDPKVLAEKVKVDATNADKTDLSPAGLDAAATMFAKTGQLPALGMGDKVTRKQIINRAAALVPGLDVASAKADYTANIKSLGGLQAQRDAIGAFENTALKNLDVFITAAEKVPDTGSPFFNRPLRALSETGLGSTELTAYRTARQTVIPEFAKLLANPGLSGQLSDSARKEVQDVVSGNATLAQTLAATKILKTDAANRRTSYDDQIVAINDRIKKAGGSAQPDVAGGTAPTDPLLAKLLARRKTP
jgi:hypothetical protein